jgi:hypothetical protein
VAGYDGVVSTYEVNTTDGGECKRISEDLLFNISMISNNKQSTVTNARRNTTGKYMNKEFYLAIICLCHD